MKKYFCLSCLCVSITFYSLFSLANSNQPLPDDRVLVQLTQQARVQKIPVQFDVFTWNTHKGSSGVEFQSDFLKISPSMSLIFLQEAMNDSMMPPLFQKANEFDTWMAQSFLMDNKKDTTGVTTLSSASPRKIEFERSPQLEPVTNTPKMSLLSFFQMENGDSLLAINVHGINFVSNSSFENQIQKLKPWIQNFSGKIILAGDFNTWNSARSQFLKKWTADLGLVEVQFPKDPRSQKLDHIFIKGCQIQNPQVWNHIKSSDHVPLYTHVNCQ